jgi:hypothetical protein
MEEPIYRSLDHNQAFLTYNPYYNNHSNHLGHSYEKSSESSISKSFSPSTFEKSFSNLYLELPHKSSPSSPSSHRSQKHRSQKSLSRKTSSRRHSYHRTPPKFSSSYSHNYDANMVLGTAPSAPLYQEAWKALQGETPSPTQSEELILRRASCHRAIPSRKSSSTSEKQKRNQNSSRSVFSVPPHHSKNGNVMSEKKKRKEEKLRHTSFSGKFYGDSANDQEETEICEPEDESLSRTHIPSVYLPFPSLGIMRCSRFVTWSPLIRLLPTLASRLRSFGCTLTCEGLSRSSTQSRSFREENGLFWTPLAKIRAVHLNSSLPLTCVLTIFRLSLSEFETEKDEEGKWQDSQPLLVDCHRVKGDLLVWNQLFQLLNTPIPDPPTTSSLHSSPLSPLSSPSPSIGINLLPGVEHKGSHSSPSKEELS